jgi:hypothetical protein
MPRPYIHPPLIAVSSHEARAAKMDACTLAAAIETTKFCIRHADTNIMAIRHREVLAIYEAEQRQRVTEDDDGQPSEADEWRDYDPEC